jgi:hypothetical protein
MATPVRWTRQCAPVWGEPPPPPKIRKYERLQIYPGKNPPLIIVSASLHELRTHFVDKRTVPCTEGSGKCWLDHTVVGKARYGGWLAVRHPSSPKTVLLCLTPVAVAVEPRLREMVGQLRGLTLHVWRLGDNLRSEMNARLDLGVHRLEDLAPEPDVRFMVERMMAADDRPDKKNREKYGAFSQATGAAAEGHAADLGRQGVKP